MPDGNAINVGSVGVEVVPDARGFGARLSGQITPEARALGREIGAEFGREFTASLPRQVREGIQSGLRETSGQGTKGGNDFGGSFATAAKARISAAFRDLPKARVGTDASELDAELVAIRGKLEALRDVHIGVDLDAGEALAEIELVRERLIALAARSPHIDVKVDAAKAAAELLAIKALAESVSETNVSLPTGGGSGLGSLAGQAASLGESLSTAGLAAAVLATALIPIAAGLAAVAAAAVALGAVLAGAFAGALVGLIPIVKAITALSAADKESASTARSSATSRINAATAVQSATASLANAQANADSANIRSAQAVSAARRGLADAQRQAARTLADAVRGEADAETRLTVALREQKDAQTALTEARKDAQRQIEDLQRAVVDGALDEKQAQLDVQQARQRLQEINSDPLSTNLDRQQARLSYEAAQQRLEDLQAANQRLGEDAAAAAAKGVDGADSVLAAQQNLADATRATATAQRDVADATQHLADVQITNARNLADAQRSIVDALRAQADQARQSAFAISQAQAALAAAGRAQATAGQQSSAALDKANKAMASLTPAGQAFVKFLRADFIPALKTVMDSATNGLAPGLMQGLLTLQGIMPDIARDMGKFAGAAGTFFAKIASGLASPNAKKFFDFLADLSGPALSGLATFLVNLADGFSGLLQALQPFTAAIGQTLLDLSQKFADFGNSTGEGGALDKFVGFLNDHGAEIASSLADIAKAVGDLVVAYAPVGVLILETVDAIAKLLDKLSPLFTNFTLLLGPIGLVVEAFGSVRDAIGKVKTAGGDIARFFRDGVWGGILAALSGPFTAGVRLIQDAFGDIKGFAVGARDYVEGRFDVLVGYVEGLGGRISRAAVGMFDGIVDAFKGAINSVIDIWNNLSLGIDVPSKVFGVPIPGGGGHFGIETPDIPRLALGGIVSGPTLAMIGEGSESEAVMPLSVLGDFSRWAQELGWNQAASRQSFEGGGNTGGPRTVIERLDIHNPVPEPATVSASKTMRRLEHTLS